MQFSVEVKKSRRKTISLSVEKDLHVLVKAPLFMKKAGIEAFLNRHRAWIETHIALQKERQEKAHLFTPEEVSVLADRARDLAQTGIWKYAPLMGVQPEGLKITGAVTRWGSCSGKNRICFSYRIALLPPEASDYIIVHELAHIRQKNHGPNFYAEVAKILPDYKERIVLLKQTQRDLGL